MGPLPIDSPISAAPRHVDYDEIMRGLKSLEGVRSVHSLNIWSLTLNQIAVAAHLVTGIEACAHPHVY